MLIRHRNGYHYDWWPDGSTETKPVGSFDLFENKVRPEQPLELWSFGIREEDNFGKGYGQQMLREAIAMAGDHDIKLFVESRNAPAIHIYKKMGFVRSGNYRENAFIGSMIKQRNAKAPELDTPCGVV